MDRILPLPIVEGHLMYVSILLAKIIDMQNQHNFPAFTINYI